MTVGRAGELARFEPESFRTVTLFANEHVRVLLAALQPGQQIPLHAPRVDLVVTVADGVGELLAGERVHPLHAGDVAVVPAGETRGVRARTARLVLVTVVTPPPGEADHAPVEAGWPDATGRMPDPAGLIKAEHAELGPHLDHLRALADAVESVDEPDLRERLGKATRFLRGGILAHAAHEEETVYPAAERLLRALGGATATMTLEHELIADRVDELDTLAARTPYDASTRAELRRSLVALEAVLRGHFDKEERVYLPLLAHLAAEEADTLATALETPGHGGHDHEH